MDGKNILIYYQNSIISPKIFPFLIKIEFLLSSISRKITFSIFHVFFSIIVSSSTSPLFDIMNRIPYPTRRILGIFNSNYKFKKLFIQSDEWSLVDVICGNVGRVELGWNETEALVQILWHYRLRLWIAEWAYETINYLFIMGKS